MLQLSRKARLIDTMYISVLGFSLATSPPLVTAIQIVSSDIRLGDKALQSVVHFKGKAVMMQCSDTKVADGNFYLGTTCHIS